MYVSDAWREFSVLDAGNGNKLERWGDVILLRPDPQAIWPMDPPRCADATYLRSRDGGGHWEFNRELPQSWELHYKDLTFLVRPTGFKHTGLFPEQAVNWDWMQQRLRRSREKRVLNLFAYTGGATAACAAAGAQVVHVDAAKGMVAWAKTNLAASGLADAPVRYIVDDAMKFVQREARRGNRYDGIVMDPPSYGRGPTGEMWKIERDLFPLVEAAVRLLSPEPCFFLLNSYTTGLAPSAMENLLNVALSRTGASVTADEVGLPIENRRLVLPCGASARACWE